MYFGVSIRAQYVNQSARPIMLNGRLKSSIAVSHSMRKKETYENMRIPRIMDSMVIAEYVR